MNNLFQSLNQWFYFRSIWSVIIIRRIWKRLFSEFFRYWRILGDYCQDLLQKIEEFFSIDYMDSDWRTLKSKWSSNFITYFHFVDKESPNCQTVATSDHDVGDRYWRRNILVTDFVVLVINIPYRRRFLRMGTKFGWLTWRFIWWCFLYSEMRLSYLSNSFGNGIYLILSSGSKCFEMETKHLLVELFSWLQNPTTSLRIPQFLLAG